MAGSARAGAPAIDAPEHSTRDGATALAQRLRAYWAKRGRAVTVEIERRTIRAWNPDAADDAIWGLKSDIGSWAA